jgi:hypothetical protein
MKNTIQQRKGSWKLLWVHFPGSEIIPEPSEGWDGLELEFPKWKGSREDWAVSKRVVSCDKLKWAVFSFQPYKSPGIDGIMPIMPQQGFELLAGKLLMLLRASLALGYIPMSWRHIRVVYTPKPGKPLSQAKSLQPISLMSFILKTLEKLIDISGVVFWLKNHFIRTSLTTGQVCPQKQLSSRLLRLEKSFNQTDCVGCLPEH